jgi:hypothetical protein
VIDEIVSEFCNAPLVNENVGFEAPYTFEALVVVAVTVKFACDTVTVAAFVPTDSTVSVALTVIE